VPLPISIRGGDGDPLELGAEPFDKIHIEVALSGQARSAQT
jgi:hypothetical protein